MKHFMAFKLTLAILAGIASVSILTSHVLDSPIKEIISITLTLFGIFIIFVGEKPIPKTILQS